MVLHRGDQDLIARLDMAEPVAVGHKVQPLGRVAGEDDLLALRRAEKAGDGGAGALERVGRLDAQRVEPAQGDWRCGAYRTPAPRPAHTAGAGRWRRCRDRRRRAARAEGNRLCNSCSFAFLLRTQDLRERTEGARGKASSSAMRASRSTAARARMASAAARSMPRLAK